MAKRITATKAARKLSDILDRVEHAGEEFVVERHGRVVAMISPPAAGASRSFTVGDLRRLVATLPKPDPRFAKDLAEIRRRQPRLPRNPWPSSSTPRS